MTLYHVTHPNGNVYVMEADTAEEAVDHILDELHPDAACEPTEFVVEITEEDK